LGLFPLCRIVRFVDGISPSTIETSSRLLLECFFESLTVRTVCLAPHSRSVTLKTAEAIGACSRRMAELIPIPNGSRGISFDIKGDSNTKSDWSLIIHRGPLPILDLTTSIDGGFHPDPGWGASLIEKEIADVYCDGKGHFGVQHSIYLLLKQQRLFPYSTGKSAPEAVAAGLELRRMCLKISTQESHQKQELYMLYGGSWKKRRFLQQFDSALVDAAGSANLEEVLKTMGTDIDLWLQEK
jgi:hypothetical protein